MCYKVTRRVLYHEIKGTIPVDGSTPQANGVEVQLTGYFDPNDYDPDIYLIQTAVITNGEYTMSTTRAITQFTNGNPETPSDSDLIRKAIKTFDDLVSVHPVLSEATDAS